MSGDRWAALRADLSGDIGGALGFGWGIATVRALLAERDALASRAEAAEAALRRADERLQEARQASPAVSAGLLREAAAIVGVAVAALGSEEDQ